jgi:3-dehydroquinate synthase
MPDVTLTLQYRHRVAFTRAAFDPGNHTLAQAFADAPANSRGLIVLDRNLAHAWPDLVDQLRDYWATHRETLPTWVGLESVPGGETAKNDPAVHQQLLSAIASAGLCRQSYLLVIGGGAVLDAAGFAAAIAHRGVRLVRMPSTTLAQDDAGVGVKNGINAFGKKNFLGAFTVPAAVVNDLDWLQTLTDRDWRSGLSEAVKVALLKEPELFYRIERDADRLAARDATVADDIWQASARLHVDHIANSGDPFEETTARPLDFGHWAAHRLEALSEYALNHGEAVAIGLALDVTCSAQLGWLDPAVAGRIRQCLRRLGFALDHPALEQIEPLMAGLDEFRQHLGGQLTLTMLQAIGQPVQAHALSRATVEAARTTLAEDAATPA